MPPYLVSSGLKKRDTPDDDSIESATKEKKKGKKTDGKQKGGGKVPEQGIEDRPPQRDRQFQHGAAQD